MEWPPPVRSVQQLLLLPPSVHSKNNDLMLVTFDPESFQVGVELQHWQVFGTEEITPPENQHSTNWSTGNSLETTPTLPQDA